VNLAGFAFQEIGTSPLPESPVSGHEGFKHVRNQGRGTDGFAVGLCVEGGVAVEVGFEDGRAGEG